MVSILALSFSAVEVEGQRGAKPGVLAMGPSLGRHGIGVVLELSPFPRTALAGAFEGLNFGGKAVAGIGVRVDLHQENTGRVYTRVLYGKVKCLNPIGGGGGCPFGNAARSAVGPGAGIELRLSENGNAWAGIEAGYWAALRRDPLGRELEHFAFAAVLRFRS
jgi:hypothetical protein